MMEELIKLTNALYKVTGLFPTKEPLKFAIRKESLDVLFFCIASEKQVVQSQINQRESFIQKGLDCLKLLKTYFEIAKEQKWIDTRNFLVLESEYLLVENTLNNELLKIIADKKFSAPKVEVIEKIIVEKKEEPKREAKQETEKKVNHNTTAQPKETVKKPEPIATEKSFDEIDYEKLTSIQLKVLELLQGSGQLKPNEINKHFPEVTPRSIRRELKGLKERHIIGTVGSGKTISYKINLAV
ncbi:MAG: hypothetical protein WC470_00605 [Candidatus Paceibacterota bacterium]